MNDEFPSAGFEVIDEDLTALPDYKLHQLADLFAERNAVYGNDWERFGKIMDSMFPDGITLKGPKSFERASIMFHMVTKFSRYTGNFESGGHADSLDDLSVYAQIMSMLDKKHKNEK